MKVWRLLVKNAMQGNGGETQDANRQYLCLESELGVVNDKVIGLLFQVTSSTIAVSFQYQQSYHMNCLLNELCLLYTVVSSPLGSLDLFFILARVPSAR